MTPQPPRAYGYDAVRTPFGRYGGAFAEPRPDDLAAAIRIGVGQGPAVVLDNTAVGNTAVANKEAS